jgi:hypothetical protein
MILQKASCVTGDQFSPTAWHLVSRDLGLGTAENAH